MCDAAGPVTWESPYQCRSTGQLRVVANSRMARRGCRPEQGAAAKEGVKLKESALCMSWGQKVVMQPHTGNVGLIRKVSVYRSGQRAFAGRSPSRKAVQ